MKPIGLIPILVACLALAACGDDDDTGAGSDAGGQDSGGPGDTDAAVRTDAGKDAASPDMDSGTDASSTEDSGMEGDAGGVSFTVPSAGGSFNVTAGSVMLTFKFPASAAGEDITLTPTDPADATFADPSLNAAFGTVIDMQPDGATFADPIEVTFSDGTLVAFNLKDGVLTPLPLATDGKSLLVSHFSALAVPLSADLCESASPWSDSADAQFCSSYAPATTARNFTCKNYRFCYVLNAACCVDPSVSTDAQDGCALGDPGLYLYFQRTGSNGGQYTYCDDGLPTSTSVSPTSVQYDGSDETVTLYGTNFVPNGSALLGQLVLATTFVSSTQVTAVIPGASLNGVQSVGIRYAIPTWNATGPCTNAATGNCDWNNATVAQTVTVTTGGGGNVPTVTSITGTLLANGQDQQITLNGTNFDPNGSAFQNLDSAITTSWQSSTLAYATVPGTLLQSPGTLQDVGFVNPTSGASGACSAAAPGNCDWLNGRSNTNDLTIDAVASSCLSGGTQIVGVGSGTCAAPTVVDLRNDYSGDIREHYIAQAAGGDEAGEPSSTYCGVTTTARDFVYQVLLPAGADLDLSVDGVNGSDPVIFVHEDSACTQPINACANDTGADGCEFVSVTHGSGAIFGQGPYVTLSEATSTGVAFYTRFKLTGTIATPSLYSLNPTSATAQSGATITVNMQNGSGWAARAMVSAGGGGSFEEYATCTPTGNNTCEFILPNSLSAGTHDVQIEFTGRTGSPFATGTLTLTVN